MATKLGTIIKLKRNEKGFSQKELANDICAQSMLSAIENNKYVPNAQLLIRLCKRLEINLNEISLADNYAVSSNKQFNKQVEYLCNQHQYSELKNYLESNNSNLKSAEQLQAYYYYLAVACLQTGELKTVKQDLKLSLAESGSKTLQSLTYMALSYLAVLKKQKQLALKNMDLAFNKINQVNYDENQNILYYLAALIYFKLGEFTKSVTMLNKGIAFITKHDSHYMLANCYYLMAILAGKMGQDDKKIEAGNRQSLFNELFGEKIYKDI